MKEKDLIKLGFKKEVVEPGDSGLDEQFYYYSLDIAYGFSFLSCTNDEVIDGNWFVDFFDSQPSIRFKSSSELSTMINLAIANKA
jgi:hypothetical protein